MSANLSTSTIPPDTKTTHPTLDDVRLPVDLEPKETHMRIALGDTSHQDSHCKCRREQLRFRRYSNAQLVLDAPEGAYTHFMNLLKVWSVCAQPVLARFRPAMIKNARAMSDASVHPSSTSAHAL